LGGIVIRIYFGLFVCHLSSDLIDQTKPACTPSCTSYFSKSNYHYGIMKADVRISVKANSAS
jgi:hypothetical protein